MRGGGEGGGGGGGGAVVEGGGGQCYELKLCRTSSNASILALRAHVELQGAAQCAWGLLGGCHGQSALGATQSDWSELSCCCALVPVEELWEQWLCTCGA